MRHVYSRILTHIKVYSSAYLICGTGLVRSSSQDDADSSAASSGYATADTVVRRGATSSGSASSTSAASKRGSFYASGTQSAYGSRDTSPDTSGRRTAAYPAVPPSMIITPSHTPRRAASVESEAGDTPLTSADILRLYEKLNAIERETEKDITLATATAMLASSAADRRGRTMARSSTVTAGADINGATQPTISDSQPSGRTAAPGKLTTSARSASVSPRTARRQFYEDYPYDPSKRGAGVTGTTAGAGGQAAGETSRGPGRPDPTHAPRSASVTRDDPLKSRLTSAASSFFQSIKDRRKLFGAKKSSSVDSATQASIARIGANVLPAIPEPQPSSSGSSRGPSGGVKSRRRTASDDVESATTDTRSSTSRQDRSSSVTRDGTC